MVQRAPLVAPSSLGRAATSEFPVGPVVPLVKLDFKDLHVRHPRALEPLYASAGKPCPSCGVRFQSNEKYQQHLDWHFKQNRRDEKTRALRNQSRAWFVSASAWHQDTGNEAAQVAAEANPFGESAAAAAAAAAENVPPSRVLADESQPMCAICKEHFTRLWVEDEDQWMYDEVERFGGSLVHSVCLKDATPQTKALP